MIRPLNDFSAVFDKDAEVDMPGNSNSSFLGWGSKNTLMLLRDSGATFNLDTILLGPITDDDPFPVSITLTGRFRGGRTESVSFDNVTTAKLAAIGWEDLWFVEFRSDDDAGMDNVVVCYADCDGSGVLDVFDFLCFQDLFVAEDRAADCDGNGAFDIFDFLCFQDAFVTGCP